MNNYKFLDFFKKVDEVYPSGLVSGLNKHKSLLNEAKSIANYKNLSLKNLFETSGYRYIYKDIKIIRKELKKEISIYANTNKSLNNLHKIDSALYYKVLRYANLEEIEISDYIESLGFKYNRKEKKEKICDIRNTLAQLFPNKKVEKLSVKDSKLYSKIYKLAKKENLNVNEYIKKIGFNV